MTWTVRRTRTDRSTAGRPAAGGGPFRISPCNGLPSQGNCGGSPPATTHATGGQHARQPPPLGGPGPQPRLGHVGLRVPVDVPAPTRHLTVEALRRHVETHCLGPSERGL